MTKPLLYIIIALLVIIVAAVVFGAIQTVRVVKLQARVDSFTQTVNSMTAEVIEQDRIIDRWERYRRKIDAAQSVADYIEIWKEIQNETNDNNN